MDKRILKAKLLYKFMPIVLSGAIATGYANFEKQRKIKTYEDTVKEYTIKTLTQLGEKEAPGYYEVREDSESYYHGDGILKRRKHIELNELNKELNVGNVTWDDIREVINNNKYLPEDVKNALNTGIDCLIKYGIEYDLTALYLNLQDLDIEVADIESANINSMVSGQFESENHHVVINSNAYTRKEEFRELYESAIRSGISLDPEDICHIYKTYFHEIFGHGSMGYFKKGDFINIEADNYSYIVKVDSIINANKEFIAYRTTLGDSLQEYLSDKIAYYASNKIDEFSTGYEGFAILYDILANSLDVSFKDLINNGEEALLEKVRDPKDGRAETYVYEIIHMLDRMKDDVQFGIESKTEKPYSEYINELIKRIVEIKIIKGEEKDLIEEDILSQISKTFTELNTTDISFYNTYTSSWEHISADEFMDIAAEKITGAIIENSSLAAKIKGIFK